MLGLTRGSGGLSQASRQGGLGSAVLETLSDYRPDLLTKVTRMGFPDKFADEYGSQASLLKKYGLTVENLVSTMLSKIGK